MTYAVKECFPRAVLQWEDFKKGNAFRLLDAFRHELPSFNDDIQGTAAVTVAGLMAACRESGRPLEEHRILILGAGAAGIGIAQLLDAVLEGKGLDPDERHRAVGLIDSSGLLVTSREIADAYKVPHAWPPQMAAELGLEPGAELDEVVPAYRPTVLIGTTGQPGIFSEEIVRSMADHVDRPVIFPLSNPTSRSEAKPEDLIRWTDGRAIIATGSPFDPVEYEGQTYRIAQANNVYVFPGVGLGAVAVAAREITDGMFGAAARALAGERSEEHVAAGMLYPPLTELRRATRAIAIAVAEEAIAESVAEAPEEGVEAAVDRWIWFPEYPEIVAI